MAQAFGDGGGSGGGMGDAMQGAQGAGMLMNMFKKPEASPVERRMNKKYGAEVKSIPDALAESNARLRR